ncbi:MAG: hypothetical protein JRD49_03350 [Deltaproteobacteria bacterium]|nr:hypothetical protein [Deltaproteobacteria bacterium]MBW2633746.1 hypothetical protein [Deltaproteobacteria bacterium]MBW2676583.1 hypothetical protein [Deltaproteobacteria bacterium]
MGKRTMILCLILLITSLALLLAAKNIWMLFLFAVIYGFAHGGLFTVISPTVAELFGTGSPTALFSGSSGSVVPSVVPSVPG